MPLIMPYTACRNNAYLYDVDAPSACLNGRDSIRGGFDVDSEWTVVQGYERQGVTCQIGGILAGHKRIFCHPDHAKYAAKEGLVLRHPTMQHDWAILDYLEAEGYSVQERYDVPERIVQDLPRFRIDLYAFFAVAELCMIVQRRALEEMLALVVQTNIVQERRLVTRDKTGVDTWFRDFCLLNTVWTINGYDYAPELRYIDACALHGIASYRDLLLNVELGEEVLDDKDSIHELGLIERMHEAYFSFPAEFDRYALNDLHVYRALKANDAIFQWVHKRLGLGELFHCPALTIGKTIARLFKATLLRHLAVERGMTMDAFTGEDGTTTLEEVEGFLDQLCRFGNAAHFRIETTSTAAYLAKVFGGRCRANRMTLASLRGALCDLDLSGCYGQGMCAQEYPLGRPVVLGYPHDSTINRFLTLRQFLKRYGPELVPGLYTLVVSMPEGQKLRYPQTFFPSWFGENPSKDRNTKPQDELIFNLQNPSLEIAVDSGNTKIFAHRLEHAVITSDGLDWIQYACGQKQRNELLDALYVTTAAYYPKSQRQHTVQEVLDRIAVHDGVNTCEIGYLNGHYTISSQEQECYAWTSVNLGDLLIDKLLANRQLFPKKTSKNNLYKLIINGLFGDLVSPFFDIGNTIVGNNITARARAACWYMEATLHGAQSITDGCVFDLNGVAWKGKNGRRLTPNDIYPLSCEKSAKIAERIRLAPLGGYDKICLTEHEGVKRLLCTRDSTETIYHGQAALNWVNHETMAHIQGHWPTDIRVLHTMSQSIVVLNAGTGDVEPDYTHVPRVGQYEFELKDLHDRAAFHSTANHLLGYGDTIINKARSYRAKSPYTAKRLENGRIVDDPEHFYKQTPSAVFHSAMLQNPSAVERGVVYVVPKLIKPNYYEKRHKSFFRHNNLRPGGDYPAVGLLKEFSLSQFTLNDPDQWRALEKEYERSKQQHGQYVECFFLNDDGTLNYLAMIEKVQRLIEQGVPSLLKTLNKHRNRARLLDNASWRDHPNFPTFLAVKAHLEEEYGGAIDHDLDPFASDTMEGE